MIKKDVKWNLAKLVKWIQFVVSIYWDHHPVWCKERDGLCNKANLSWKYHNNNTWDTDRDADQSNNTLTTQVKGDSLVVI